MQTWYDWEAKNDSNPGSVRSKRCHSSELLGAVTWPSNKPDSRKMLKSSLATWSFKPCQALFLCTICLHCTSINVYQSQYSAVILSYCIHGIHGPAMTYALLVGTSMSKTFKRLQGDAPTVKVCRLGSQRC